ncbi:hypothetical protein Ciccas_002064 [Cichlidogyrus casuarinus]|uniref:RUN domain-containing protein n=1 Tax=Cichlidogyrus casuarinus TaxID=1844966 RepID=A0ABD2QIA4_9PLAT
METKLFKRPTLAASYQMNPEKSKASIVQAHNEFAGSLLDECKQKTKRMVVSKMGREAISLGHSEAMVVKDMEENILVSGLCDLIERTWSHGLIKKQGKSALWTHLMQYACVASPTKSNSPRHSGSSTPQHGRAYQSRAQTASSVRVARPDKQNGTHVSRPVGDGRRRSGASNASSLNRNRQKSTERGDYTPARKPSADILRDAFLQTVSGVVGNSPAKSSFDPSASYFDYHQVFGLTRGGCDLIDDLGTVRMISGIKTDVGLSRAFIRLALEKKVLSEYLKKLLSNQILLRYNTCA